MLMITTQKIICIIAQHKRAMSMKQVFTLILPTQSSRIWENTKGCFKTQLLSSSRPPNPLVTSVDLNFKIILISYLRASQPTDQVSYILFRSPP